MAKPREGYHDMFAQIPEALWEALNADATRNERTATGQLIWILRQQYPDAGQSKPAAETKPSPNRKRGST